MLLDALNKAATPIYAGAKQAPSGNIAGGAGTPFEHGTLLRRVSNLICLYLMLVSGTGSYVFADDDKSTGAGTAVSFIGNWGIGMPDPPGGQPFVMTLNADGTASKSHIPSAIGNWNVVSGEARVVWSDGWRDIIRVEGDDFRKIAFAPGSGFEDQADNTATAKKLKTTGKVSLRVGWAQADITPDRPVGLIGFGRRRISSGAKDRITATVLALEGVDEDGKVVEQAMMISCDLISLRRVTMNSVRALLKEQLPDFESDKLIMNATHTHQAPQQQSGSSRGIYDFTDEEKAKGWMTGNEYQAFMSERIAAAALKAWRKRKAAGVSWEIDQAVVGFNRRIVFSDGTAKMSHQTDFPNFDHIEGIEDHTLSLLFFWDDSQKLTGMIINVASPAQSEQGGDLISADFWHDVREEIASRYSDDVFVLPQCAAAGEGMPITGIQQRAQKVMAQRRGINWRREIARRITDGVDRALPVARKHIDERIVFRHSVATIALPEKDPPSLPFVALDPVDSVELHLLRIGDVGMATVPFELFIDYGMRIQARSDALMTFIVQLAYGHSEYLPSARAIRGGGYSAEKYLVGPEGGRVLVDECVNRLNSLWP